MYGRGISLVSQRFESLGRASVGRITPPSMRGGRGAGQKSWHTIRNRVTMAASAASAAALAAEVMASTAQTLEPVSQTSFTARWRRYYRRKRRALYLAVLVCELLYIFTTVPLRIAFFFDPHGHSHGWTNALTIYSTFDLLSDAASIASLYEIFSAKRRALAAIAIDAGTIHVNPRNRRHQRGKPAGDAAQDEGVQPKSSLVGAWSLNTIVPTVKQKFDIRRPLLFEAIAMIPIELLAIVLGPNSLHILRVLKVFRLHRVADCVRELKKLYARRPMVQLLEFTGNALLLKRVVVGMALCHWIACMYMALAHWECGLNFQLCSQGRSALSHDSAIVHAQSADRYTCWAIEDQLVGSTPVRKYARAMYWSSRSLITLGYYDVVPTTDIETAFGIVVQITGAVFSTSLIATFLFVFRYLNARKQAFMTHVDEAKEYMRMSRIPDDVRDGVLAFYGNLWKAHNGLTQHEVTSRLPEHLRVSVLKVLVAQRIHAVSFLAKESDEFINTLALKVELCVYSPKDWIIEKVPDGMYFVIRGNVLIEFLGQTQPRHAKPGEYFAEFALLFAGKSEERARAQTYCEVYKLSQLWFRETVEMFNGGDTMKAQAQLDTMRTMLNRRDMQQQKMKRLFGRSAGNVQRDASGSGSLFGSLQMGRMAWVLPGSSFRRYWEHLRFLALTFVAYEVPYYIVFDTAEFPFTRTPTYNIQSITSIVMEVFFTVDVLLRCRFFAFIDSMAMIPVTDASYIFEHYKENGFALDLVSIIPVATVLEFAFGAQSSLGLIVPAFRLARMLRLRHFEASIQEIARLRRLSSKMQLAITLFLVVTLSIHLTGCLWFLMARFGMHEHGFGVDEAESITRPGCLKLATLYGNCSWALFDAYGQVGHGFPSVNAALNASSTSHTESAHRMLSSATSSSASSSSSILAVGSYTAKFAYLRSIYWAIVALTTIGYGDIVAFSTQESFFAALWVYFGGIINYAVVAAMSNIISNFTAASRHHMEKMNEMNSVLAHYGISDYTRNQIRRYYHQQFYIQKVASETKLLARLPQQLRHRISIILHADSVKKLSMFVDHGHERLLHDMTGLFRRGVYQRGDHLTQDNTICDEILVIVSGRGNVFLRSLASSGAKFGVPIGSVCPGSCCGVAEMLLRVKSPTFAIATTVVEVSVITYQAFVDTIEQRYPTEVALLTESALELFEAEARSLEAISTNMQTYEKLHKYTERCTSMYVEQIQDLDLDQQNRKALIRFYWDFVIAVITIYNAFQITFRIPFLEHPSTSTRRLLITSDLFGDVMLGLDIVLKLYYFECDVGLRNIITRAEKNANYASHFLKQDLWGMLPLYYFGESFLWTSLMRLPRLLRIRQLPAAFDSLVVRLQQRVASGENISSYLAPFKLMMILLFAAHFGACVFYWISTMDENPNSWVHHDHVVHEAHGSIGVLYLRAYYWALTTLTLVGSREVVPLDVPGTLFASLMCLCCTFVVGHIIGELSDMILDMDLAKKELQERETSFEQFAKDHNLPLTIRTRVNHYLKFQHHHSKGFDIYETFHDLSSNLKVQLMMDLHGSVLRGLCIAPFLNEGHLRGLATRLKSELYIPGDTVIVEGDPGHKLYILKSGSAAVMWKSTGTAVATLTEGTLFGEVAFFLRGTKRIASVQATASIEVLSVDRRAWDKLMNASEELERKTTERVLVEWVKDCLKGYNVMTVEIVKDIKNVKAGGNADLGLLEERALRLLLTRASKHGEPEETKPKVTGHFPRFALAGMFSSRNVRRIYATGAEDDQTNEKPKNRSAVVTPAGKSGGPNTRKPSLKVSLPTLKSSSTKNGTMRQLFPLANELKDLYNQRQLHDMEDECWRRYKVSILMSGTIVSREMGSVVGPGTRLNANSNGSRTDSMLASSISAAKALIEDKSRKASSLMWNRKASTKPSFALRGLQDKSTRGSLNSSRNDGVTTDGMRLLANYQTIEEATVTTNPKVALHKGPSELSDAITARQVVKRRRILKRTQSLPIFDRHFADMVREELKASNVKDYASKLHLGFEVQRRVRRPEFSYLFRIYKWWQRTKVEWAKSRIGSALASRRALKRRSSVNGRRLSGMTFPGMRRESNGRFSTGRSSSTSAIVNLPPRDEGEIFFELLSRWYRIWECFVVIIAVFYALSLPYLICFTSRTHTLAMSSGLTYWTAFVCLMDVFCLLDLVLKYTTFQGVMEIDNESHHNTTPREGSKPHALRISGYFILDAFAALPFDWLLFLPQLYVLAEAKWFYLALFQFNKIFRIYQAKEASERLAQFLAFDLNLPVSDRTLRFIRSIGAYLLAGHWIACFWFRLSLHAFEHSPTSWLSTKKMLALDEFTTLDDVSYLRRYLRSAHFAAGSITTVFYGDIASSNLVETIAEIFVILLSIFVFGMVVGAHSEYLESKYKHRMQFEQNLSELYVYLKNNDVPRTVRSRLKTYYMNTWLRFHGHDDFEGVQGLSTLLVEDIAQYTLRNFAAKVSILKNCDECFLRALLTCLKNVICAPNEPVVRKGDVDRSMYFIARGKIIVEGKGFQLVKEEGDFFGELSLLYGIPRSATCSSLGTSLLYVLEWHAYEVLLKDYPEYREVNRREWVVVSTVLRRGESRFRSIIDIVARMWDTSWIQVDSIIKKAKTLK